MNGTYRFALIGQTNSGKTCYLTTLAMQAIGHPGGMTVAWKRDMLGEKAPASSAVQQVSRRVAWTSRQAGTRVAVGESSHINRFDERTSREKGTAWIRAAIQSIEAGRLPKGNPPERCILDYDLGSPDRGTTPVSLVDYAGEAINADVKGASRDEMLRHFRSCDGLIVIAEAIPDDSPNREIIEARIRTVVDYFVSLHGDGESRLATAVAVVLTKWDSISPVDFDDPASENQDIEDYISTRPLYRNLVEAVSNIVLQQHDVSSGDGKQVGLQKGNTRVFASSSFGHSIQEPDGTRTPLLSEKRPFCLIDPLLWLADRSDAIVIAELNESSQGWRAWMPWTSWKSYHRARRAASRMPPKAAGSRKVLRFRDRALGCIAAWVALAILSADMARFASLRRDVGAHRSAVISGRSNAEDLASAREYGLGVAATSWPGLLPAIAPWFAPDGQGLATLATESLEKTLGDAAEESSGDESVKALRESLEKYLKYLPNGARAGDFAARLEKLKDVDRLQQPRDRLAELGVGIPGIDKETCKLRLGTLSTLLADATDWPSDMKTTASRIREHLDERYRNIIENETQQELRVKIDEAIELDNFVAAVDSLLSHTDKNADWEQVALGLPERIIEACRNRVQSLVSRQRFQEATVTANSARAAILHGEDLPIRFPASRESFQRSLPILNKVVAEGVSKPYDQYLYGEVCRRKDEEACEEYLADAPLNTMTSVVSSYQKYLADHSSPRPLKVTAHITWGQLAWDGGSPSFDIHEVVSVRRENVIDTSLRTTGRTGVTEVLGNSFTMNARSADEQIDVDIELTERDYPGRDDNIGSWAGKITPLEMQGKKKFTITGDKGSLVTPHTVWFTVDEAPYPAPPELRPWSEKP